MNPDNNYVISYRALRQLIGVLGIALPFICWGTNAFVNGFNLLNNELFVDKRYSKPYCPDVSLKSSVSHFYYTAAGPIFTGILMAVAIFLFCYKGHEPRKDEKWKWLTDSRLTIFAACCALGIVAFPTGSTKPITDNLHIFVSSTEAGALHLTFAALFFVAIALLCLVNFRRNASGGFIEDAEGKLYLICGWGMLACLAILAIFNFTALGDQPWVPYNIVYILEAVMLVLFGTAWLVKGKSMPTEFMLKKI